MTSVGAYIESEKEKLTKQGKVPYVMQLLPGSNVMVIGCDPNKDIIDHLLELQKILDKESAKDPEIMEAVINTVHVSMPGRKNRNRVEALYPTYRPRRKASNAYKIAEKAGRRVKWPPRE